LLEREKRRARIRENPGRGGCGIVALADVTRPPSHELLELALGSIACMEHRGGCLEDTGDGAGLLFRPERSFFERFIAPGRHLPAGEPLIVGTAFFVHGERNERDLQREVDALIRREGLQPLGWRRVPVDPQALGVKARADVPGIQQVLVGRGHRLESQLAKELCDVRRRIEDTFAGQISVPSLQPHTVVYKALATGAQLPRFYPDLRDPELKTRVVLGHRRFSTNTFSNWNLAQPFRLLAHNGEINTIRANVRAVRDVERVLGVEKVLLRRGSDSAQLDRAIELLATTRCRGGVAEAMRRMMPPSWREEPLSPHERRFFEASQRVLGTLGAWEGPAALVASDGHVLIAMLDRMGLRPLRWVELEGGRIVVASEIGSVAIDPAKIVRDGQLEPGAMLLADLESGTLVTPEQSTQWILHRADRELGFGSLSTTELLPLPETAPGEALSVRALNAFGWTREHVQRLQEMAKSAKEPVHSMGNDRPLPAFTEGQARLYGFLDQIVAVVTNPPIDPLREGEAMDLNVLLGRSPYLGQRGSYKVSPQYKLPHPVLTNEELAAIEAGSGGDELRARVLDATFADRGDAGAITERIHALCEEAVEAVRGDSVAVLIVSDREAARSDRLPIPAVLVVGALHRRLTAEAAALRRDTSIVVSTGEVQEGHDAAVLIAYGATAVNPYAMLHLADTTAGVSREDARANVVSGLVGTLKRIMSKMGIPVIAGYRGSALFEAVGLAPDVVHYFLPDTESLVGGITLEDVYRDIVLRAEKGGELARPKDVNVYRKDVTNALQMVARNGNANGEYDEFVKTLEETGPVYLRDLLHLTDATEPLPLDAVADAPEIVRACFRGAAMSHGALHSTAHRAIAAGFNHFGALSNSGEGGEDERRNPGGPWEEDRNRVRQVASGRFGVDAAYLVGADELEIKIGQGAKPGEGGHLPAKKVTAEIAAIRKTRPGVDLISPPPHHDIYSIEDLAQLIRHLREVNPRALMGVKVPSITGLGTIVVGVAKAGADVITVSGCTGGTGAATSGSIFHAGNPLERGLSEAHQYLVENGIRERVRLVADGGIKYGVDVAKTLALGADVVAFGTALLVAENCVFCRGCNAGNCPVGITTNDTAKVFQRFMVRHREDLKKAELDERYVEARAGVIRYLTCVAEHVRRILARLGLRHPRELIGRVDLLEQRKTGNPRWDRMDLGELLHDWRSDPARAAGSGPLAPRGASRRNADLAREARRALEAGALSAKLELDVTTADHALGATLAGEIARGGFPSGEIALSCRGVAGQGFGFAATRGMRLRLEGFANDTVGAAMGQDARIVIVPPPARHARDVAHLIGNAAAYGATGGTLYVAGKAGQRFGVRNSGAVLVAEGVGKYAFEYMTGGMGVVLGRCGSALGSGLTGGEVAVFDPDGTLERRIHSDARVVAADEASRRALRALVEDFVRETASPRARDLLERWETASKAFRWVRAREAAPAQAPPVEEMVRSP
jgi:glutamate synthase domain-containing protein 2/glutamate synthase domain-containing protein 1/glutamate synthase domain-containing protein 3